MYSSGGFFFPVLGSGPDRFPLSPERMPCKHLRFPGQSSERKQLALPARLLPFGPAAASCFLSCLLPGAERHGKRSSRTIRCPVVQNQTYKSGLLEFPTIVAARNAYRPRSTNPMVKHGGGSIMLRGFPSYANRILLISDIFL